MSRIGNEDTTSLLAEWSAGCKKSADKALARVYPDLWALAGRHASKVGLSESRSDLAQELCLALLRQRSVNWRNRGHFFALASKLSRRLSVDRRRTEGRKKRGGELLRVDLEDAQVKGLENDEDTGDVDVLDLHVALEKLAGVSPAAAQVTELRYFGGLSIEETAEVLEVGRATVVRLWRFARAWLLASMRDLLPEQEEA